MMNNNQGFINDYDEALITIEHNHYEVHKGLMFTAFESFSSVADEGTAEILIVCSANTQPHINFLIYADGKNELDLYEQPTVTENGTDVSAVNMNRTSNNINKTNIYHTPTITSDGNLLLNLIGPGGSTSKTRIGGELKTMTEFVLKEGYTYLLRITNKSGANADINFRTEFYEESI